MRVLVLATRSPYGRQSGRKAVLRTIVSACRALGHDVQVMAITHEVETAGEVPVERLAPPRLPRTVVNVLTKATTGRLCLNECLYVSPTIQHRIAERCATWSPDVVIADMIRTASLALGTGLPTVVDLDDLLSRRYQDLARGRADPRTLLGYYGGSLPPAVQRIAATLAARLVGIEVGLVGRREMAVGRAAGAVSLVARDEAASFERRIGRPVAWLPMAVSIPLDAAPVASNPSDRVLFVGGLDYHANVEAVQMYVEHVAPALRDLGLGNLRLRVVGHCPDDVRRELGASPAVELVGYVDDLAGELASARAFVAPIPPGTGIKTKVLEAMAAGLPVAATPDAVHGIGVTAGRDCLVGSTGAELAGAVARLVSDPPLAAEIGRAARTVVAERFSIEVVTERWRDVLDALLGGRGEAR